MIAGELKSKISQHLEWLESIQTKIHKDQHDNSRAGSRPKSMAKSDFDDILRRNQPVEENDFLSEDAIDYANAFTGDENTKDISEKENEMPYIDESHLRPHHMEQSHHNHRHSESRDRLQPHQQQQPKRWEMLYELNDKMKKAKEQIHIKEQAEARDPECTFKPQVLTHGSYGGQIQNGVSDANKFAFYERNQIWAEQKKRKLDDMKKHDQTKDVDKCTFQPTTGLSQSSMNQVMNANKNEGNVPSKGVDKFIKRQMQARQMKEEKEQIIQNLGGGNNWKNKITIPQSPNLGVKTTPIDPVQTGHGYSHYNSGNHEQEVSQKRKEIYHDPRDIHVSDVSWGEAVQLLHDALHQIEINLD